MKLLRHHGLQITVVVPVVVIIIVQRHGRDAEVGRCEETGAGLAVGCEG